MTTSPATTVIYLIKFLVFHFLGSDSLEPKSHHCRENQLALGTDVNISFCLHNAYVNCEFEVNIHYYESNAFYHEIRQIKPGSRIFPSV